MTFRYIQIGRNYLSGTHAIANRREHPRTLILDGQGEFADRVQREVDLPGTVKVIDDLGRPLYLLLSIFSGMTFGDQPQKFRLLGR